jgi:hypothetical protein
MKMRIKVILAALGSVLVALAFVPRFTPSTKQPEPAPWHFGFSAVKAYCLNWEDQYSFDSIVQGKDLNETRSPREGILLSDGQTESLRQAILNRNDGGVIGMCRYPHHAFVFFGDDDQVVGHYDVCFLCSSAGGSPGEFSGFPDYGALAALVKDLGLPTANPEWKD